MFKMLPFPFSILQGESDTEENTSPSCNRRIKPRSDSDVDDIDIKADILKNIGPIQTDGEQNKSREPAAKRREVSGVGFCFVLF